MIFFSFEIMKNKKSLKKIYSTHCFFLLFFWKEITQEKQHQNSTAIIEELFLGEENILKFSVTTETK